MSFFASLQQLLAESSLPPPRLRLFPLPPLPGSGSRLSRSTSAIPDYLSPPFPLPPQPPHSTPPNTRRLHPFLSSRSSLLPSHASRCVLLLAWLCLVHIIAIVALYVFFTSSSTPSPHLLDEGGGPLTPLAPVPPPKYSPPVSLLALSKKRKGRVNDSTVLFNQTFPVNVTEGRNSSTETGKDPSDLPAAFELPALVEEEVEGQPLPHQTAELRPLVQRVSSSLLSFTAELQQSACPSSSSPSHPPPSLLVYSCASNAVYVEHSDELYHNHHLGGVYSLTRAFLMALATQRALVLDRSSCADVTALNDTGTRDAGLACCDWDDYFLPLIDCAVPPETLLSAVTSVSPFNVAPVVAFDVRQQCLMTSEVWGSIEGMFPQLSQYTVMKTLTSHLLRPSPSMANHLRELKEEMQIPEGNSLALHVAPFTPASDNAQQLTFSRYLPLSTYLTFIRNQAATTSTTPHSTLLLWTTDEDLTPYKTALPHLQVISVYTLVCTHWVLKSSGEALGLGPLISTVLLMSELTTEWVGLHASAATQLVQLRASNPLRVWDVSGDWWTSSCWSSASHLLSAHHAEPVAYNNPAMAAILTSSSTLSPPLIPPTQIVVLLGNLRSGAEQFFQFLSAYPGFDHEEELSNKYSEIFVSRDSVEAYERKRGAFLFCLREVVGRAKEGGRRVLLKYHMPSQKNPDLSLHNHHHVSFLAQLINAHSLPASLHVLVMTRDGEYSVRSQVWNEEVPKLQRDAQTHHLPIAKPMKDVMAAIESECEAMDVSVYRTFYYDKLWGEESREVEATRMAAYLRIDSSEVGPFIASFLAYAQLKFTVMFRPPLPPKHKEDNEAVKELMVFTGSMQILNQKHPAYHIDTLDYHRLLKTAMTQPMPSEPSLSFIEHLQALQRSQDCAKMRVLVYNGFLRWTRGGMRTSVATKLLDVVRAMTLALATGRVLVVPKVIDSVLESLEPLSSCDVSEYSVVEVVPMRERWTASGLSFSSSADATSDERVLISHSQVIDVGYLAVWNANHPQQRLSTRDFIGSIVDFIIRPTAAFKADNAEIFTEPGADLTVVLPVAHHQTISSYLHSINSWIATQGLRNSTVKLTWTEDLFEHVTSPSFLSLLGIDGPLETVGPTMTSIISSHLQRHWRNVTVLVQSPEVDKANSDLRLFIQAKNSRMVMGSLGTELGFLLASAIPYSSFLDLNAQQYIPAVLAMNHRLLHHTYAPSVAVTNVRTGDPTAIPPVIEKTVWSSKVRFVFVAGLEGTGHHGVGHLLQGIREYTDVGVRYRQLQVDEWLNNFGWKHLKESNVIAWDRYRRQLLQRIKWRLDQHTTVSDTPPIFIINTIQDCIGGMQSYPNTDLPEKTTLHPSLPEFARMMESLGADFRVIALARTPGSSLASAVKRDHAVSLVGKVNAFFYLARVARANLAVLDADIAALDHRFILTLATESIQTQPEIVARGIARHLGISEVELIQAAYRMREEVVVHPSSHWMSSMNKAEMQMTKDFLDISSYLPMSSQFAFSNGLVGGLDERHLHSDGHLTGRCRTRPMGLRPLAKGVLVVTMDGAGGDYLREIIEESSAVMTSTHPNDRVLPPSTALHLEAFNERNLSAFQLLQYTIDRAINSALPLPTDPSVPIPTLILTRNPLDIALQVTFRLMMRGVVAVSDEHTWDFSRDHFAMWRREHLGEVVTLLRNTLQKVGLAYVHWAKVWRVAERRKEMLEEGVSKDGVRVLRMEDLLATPSQSLRDLLDLFQLPSDISAVDCVQRAAESVQFSPRIMGVVQPWIASRKTTLSGHPRLNVTMASLQFSLAAASYPTHSTASRPFRLAQLLPPDSFTAFREMVDATATSIEGEDWAFYCGEVQRIIAHHWGGAQPVPIAQPNSLPETQPNVPATPSRATPGTTKKEIVDEAKKIEADLRALQKPGQYDTSGAANRARARLNVLRKLIAQLNAAK